MSMRDAVLEYSGIDFDKIGTDEEARQLHVRRSPG